MKLPSTIYRSWGAGVVTSLRSDELPREASPHGQNSALLYQGGNRCVVGVRKGGELVNINPVVTAGGVPTEVRSLAEYRHIEGQVSTYYRLASTKEGAIVSIDGDGNISTVGADGTLTNDRPAPVWAVGNNIAFLANGTDRKKIILKGGTLTIQNFGLVRPSAPSLALNEAGSNMQGQYEIALGYYNEDTGHESSRSNSTSITAGPDPDFDGINVTLPTAGLDAQITHIRIYIRKPGVLNDFVRVATGTGYVGSAGGWIVGTTSVALALTDAQILSFINLAPDTVENDPPASSEIRGFAVYAKRLFAWDDRNIYYSKIGLYEAFDPEAVEPISPRDNQEIIRVWPVNDDILAVFKNKSLHGIFGSDPNSWQVRVIDPSVGSVSPSIATIEGRSYFWSQLGPMAWDHAAAPKQIGYELIAPTVDPSVINYQQSSRFLVIPDVPRQKVLFCVATGTSETNDIILPLNYRQQVWESTRWDPFEISSAALLEDGFGKPFVYFGGYHGRVFKWWASLLDGARLSDELGVPFTLSGTIDGASTTQITDLDANFDTSRLVGLKLAILSSDQVQIQTRRITAVDGETITFTPELTVVPITDGTWTYVIATPDFEWDTKWDDHSDYEGISAFDFKRYHQVYAIAISDEGNTTVFVDIYTNGSDSSLGNPERSFQFPVTGTGARFDIDRFDEAVFGANELSYLRKYVDEAGRSYRIRVRHLTPARQLVLLKLGMVASTRGDKR